MLFLLFGSYSIDQLIPVLLDITLIDLPIAANVIFIFC